MFAPVAELADAHGSGPCAGNGLGVQISSGAPKKQNNLDDNLSCSVFILHFLLNS